MLGTLTRCTAKLLAELSFDGPAIFAVEITSIFVMNDSTSLDRSWSDFNASLPMIQVRATRFR